MKRVLPVLTSLLLAAVLPAGWAENELPVRRVACFISGVGYFEHRGEVTGDSEVRLLFSRDQMNDILKSLVALDPGGEAAPTVIYPSREPLERALKSFGVDLSGDPSPGELLGSLRGAAVAIEAPERIEGKVLTVETRTEQVVPTRTVLEKDYLSLVTPEGIRTVPLDSITGLTLVEENLNAELERALELLAESRDSGRTPVTVSFRGRGQRPVRIGYIAETPVWKASYRLVLDGEDRETGHLQGWAIVENTGDFDWEGVELTLVSGRPISFIQDLYTPLYLSRPVVEPELYSSLTPRRYDEGIAPAAKAPAAPRERALMRRAEPRPALMEMEQIGPLMDQIPAAAEAAETGELFSYRVEHPVSIPRGNSAMLTIVNEPVAAEKVSIYNASVLPRHPLNGVFLTNDTGSTLPAGPVTVYDEGIYGGDGQIDSLAPGAERLIGYAIDLRLTVDSSRERSRRIETARISRGNLILTRKTSHSQAYRIKNTSDRERTLIIEHPRRRNLELVEPDEPLEETGELYRFRTAVPAETTANFTVREEETVRQTLAVLPLDLGELLRYSEDGEIPRRVRDALAEAARLKELLVGEQRSLRNLEDRRKNLREEQDHTRKNMEAVAAGTPAYNRFEKRLLELETEIDTLRERIEQTRETVERRERELADFITGLDVG